MSGADTLNNGFVARWLLEGAMLDTVTLEKGDQRR